MLSALIMAGGKGTRFWPLSTAERPKQFLSLLGSETMIQMTVNRIEDIIPLERIFVCTTKEYVGMVMEQLPLLPERNIIVEPEGRNTAPCIALSTFIINRYYPNTNMIVLPADHLIRDEKEFRNIILTANEFINDYSKSIVTLGMKPDRPETGYGYINWSKDEDIQINSKFVKKVNSFVEKPNLDKAKEYLKSGAYLWNGGMFVWNSNEILKKMKKYLPNTYKALEKLEDIEEEYIQEYVSQQYKYTDSTSIDYGILEKAEDIYVIPSEFGWDDVGSWQALERYAERDERGNICKGNVTCLNNKNNLVIGTTSDIFIDRLSDIYIIENEGKIYIGKKENISDISNLKKI